ncbi:MAG: hypothetical protein JO131_01685 [Gammaproteobacteria bacterium]|nr:hypothetical protein [Gammaproteobacteria bacterium]
MQSYSTPNLKLELKGSQKEFFTLTRFTPTLYGSLCNLSTPTGGCHSFGKSLAAEFNCDYIAAEQDDPIKLFNSEKTNPKAYKTIALTGCGLIIHSYNFIKVIANKYDCSQLKNIFVIFPPHQSEVICYSHDTCLNMVQETFANTSYKVSLLTSGITIDSPHCIGLPRLTLDAKTLASCDYSIPSDCYGLIYISNLLTESKTNNSTLVGYLGNYFSQIISIAKSQSESLPQVIAIIDKSHEQLAISLIAKKYNIKIMFIDRLIQSNFIKIIQHISEKKGIVACNGVQTFSQAMLLGAKTLFYANINCNDAFCEELSNIVPFGLKEATKVILGLSTQYALLNNADNVNKICQIITSLMEKSSQKFQELRSATQPEFYIKTLCASAGDYFVSPEKMRNPLACNLAKNSLSLGLEILNEAAHYSTQMEEVKEIKELNLAFTELATCYKNLAGKFYSAKNYREAEYCYKIYLNIYEKHFPSYYDKIITVLSNLIITAFQRHKLEEMNILVNKAEKIIPELKANSQDAIIGKIYYHKIQSQLIDLEKLLKAKTVGLEVENVINEVRKSISVVAITSKDKSKELAGKLERLQEKYSNIPVHILTQESIIDSSRRMINRLS